MIRQEKDGVLIEVRVRTSSKSFGLLKRDGKLILDVTSPPHEGKANLEIVKGLKRMFGKEVRIKRGFRGKDKAILIIGAKMDEIKSSLK